MPLSIVKARFDEVDIAHATFIALETPDDVLLDLVLFGASLNKVAGPGSDTIADHHDAPQGVVGGSDPFDPVLCRPQEYFPGSFETPRRYRSTKTPGPSQAQLADHIYRCEMAQGGAGRRVETLTVLFTDLVDSTGRRVRSGEEAADEIRLRHDRLIRSAIVGGDGMVVKHTGDGVMATFTGASEAITAGVAIQQAIDAHNSRSGDEPLQVRIGISVGDVSIEDDDCFGLPVVEAQRLESAAQPGRILISSLVRALARGRGGHDFTPVGALDLKGLDAPLEAEEVTWTPLDDRAPTSDRPPALVQRGGFDFAGRHSERTVLDDAWAEIENGSCRLVFLAGEPGIGKTRLASEFATGAAARRGHVLAGRCDEMVSVPYQPFAEALHFQLTLRDIATTLGDMPEELTRLAPEVSAVLPGLRSRFNSTPDAVRHPKLTFGLPGASAFDQRR